MTTSSPPGLGPEEVAELRELHGQLEWLGSWSADDYGQMVWSDHPEKGRFMVANIRGWGFLTGQGHGALALPDVTARIIQERIGKLIVKSRNALPALLASLDATAARVGELEEQLGVGITIGGGHILYGTVEAVLAAQDVLLIDSTHPIEAADVRRSLLRRAIAAEARVVELERENFALAANQCHDGYAGEHGDHRCREVDAAIAAFSTTLDVLAVEKAARALSVSPDGDRPEQEIASDIQQTRSQDRRTARESGFTGDVCAACGNMMMVRNGTCLKCMACGETTGCS